MSYHRDMPGQGAVTASLSFNLYRIIVIGVTAVAVLAPLSLVFYQSFLTAPFFAPNAQLSLDAYAFVFSDPDFWSRSAPR